MNIKGYRIQKMIGRGGMGTVYLATQETLSRPVALKILHEEVASDPQLTKRFLEEGPIAARLEDPQIITVYDSGVDQGHYYLAMECLPGGSLKKKIRDGLPLESALKIAKQIAKGLSHAHRRGIIHRDIKPQNILFRDDDEPVITDFGIAKNLGRDAGLTLPGQTFGSPNYISPEQARGGPLDIRSDLYSFGVVFYEMLTGELPFKARDSLEMARQHLNAPPPKLPNQLSVFQPLIDRLLAKDPKDRYASAEQFLEALSETNRRRLLASRKADTEDTKPRQAVTAAQATPVAAAPRRGPWVAVLLVLALLGAGGGVYFYLQSAPESLTRPVAEVFDSTPEPPPERDTQIPKDNSRVEVAGTTSFPAAATTGPEASDSEAESTEPTSPPRLPDTRPPEAPIQEQRSLAQDPIRPPAIAAAPAVEADTSPVLLSSETETGTPPEVAIGAPPDQATETENVTESQLQEMLDELLIEAEALASRDALTPPDSPNAIDRYRQVLSQDPYNPRARAGLNRIAGQLLARAWQAHDSGEFERARNLVAQGLQAAPTSQELLDLERRLFEITRTASLAESDTSPSVEVTASSVEMSSIDTTEAPGAEPTEVEDPGNDADDVSTADVDAPGEIPTDPSLVALDVMETPTNPLPLQPIEVPLASGDADEAVDPINTEVEQLLAQAETYMDELQLTTPRDANAHDVYRRVLQLDPDNVTARNGLQTIVERYLGWARSNLQRGRYQRSLRNIEKGLGVAPGDNRLLALRDEVEARLAPDPEPRPVQRVEAAPEVDPCAVDRGSRACWCKSFNLFCD
ncbi:MAG: protein kinase [Candidatus Competibacterales bacterium]|nr:protein kinase [Candidatus Competibacterales bacterium]